MGGTAYGIGEGPTTRVSLSLPEGTAEAIRARVGKRGFSTYIAEAVERELRGHAESAERAERRRLLREELDHHQGEFGVFTEQEMAETRALLHGPVRTERAGKHR